MSLKDDLGEIAIIMLVLYCICGAIATYPCIVIGCYFDKLYGIDAGFYSWMISMAVLWVLYLLRQIWLIVIIYVVTLVPFIFICIGWWKECYS